MRPGILSIQRPLVPTTAAVVVARRTLFGGSSKKKRGPGPKSFKSAAARWALAIGGTYYYLTSSVFAEENTCKKTNYMTGGGVLRGLI